MSLPATAVIEVRSTGNDANGGGFNAARGGTDYSQQNSPQAVATVDSFGPSLTGPPGTFTSAMVGNYVSSGTGTPVEITGFEDDTTVVIDRDPSWTSQSVNIGGALASLTKAAAIVVPNNTVYYASNTLTATAAFHCSCVLVGYGTSRTDFSVANRPTITTAGYDVTFSYDGTEGYFSIIFFGGIMTGGGKFYTTEKCVVKNLEVNSPSGVGIKCENSGCAFFNCKVSSPSTNFEGGIMCQGGSYFNCVVTGSNNRGYHITGPSKLVNCMAIGSANEGFNIYNQSGNSGQSAFVNCTAYGNSGSGFRLEGTNDNVQLTNCIAEGNGGYGFEIQTAKNQVLFDNCAGYNNTSGNYNSNWSGVQVATFIALAATAFTNAAGNNFSPSNVGVKAVGLPATFLGTSTSNYRDIGAAQHQDAGGGGGLLLHSGMTGGLRG